MGNYSGQNNFPIALLTHYCRIKEIHKNKLKSVDALVSHSCKCNK